MKTTRLTAGPYVPGTWSQLGRTGHQRDLHTLDNISCQAHRGTHAGRRSHRGRGGGSRRPGSGPGPVFQRAGRPGLRRRARRQGRITRQKVKNYHLKSLEAHGLVELSEEAPAQRDHREVVPGIGVVVRRVPGGRQRVGGRPRCQHRPPVGGLPRRAGRSAGARGRHPGLRAGASGKRLPTLTIDTQIGFRSAADRAAFADDLTAAVLDLAARYHHDDGRPHRLVVASHPLPEENS